MSSLDVHINYLSSDCWDHDMPERMRWLRKNAPVFWSEKDNLWILSKFEDVSYVSKHQEIFTSAQGVRPGNPAKIGLIDEAEPRHTKLRSLINKGFTPRMVRHWEKAFLEIVTEAIDGVADAGECDFVQSIAVPLPLILIAEMIGIRREDRGRFHQWSDHMIHADGNLDNPEVMAQAGQAFLEYSTYLTEIIEDRRQNPREDLVSILVGAKDDGVLTQFDVSDLPGDLGNEHLDLANDELILMCVILLVAGNETTRNALSGGMQALIENPDQRQKLIDDPSLIPSAAEEVVRFVSPVRSFSRTLTQDTVLRGQEMKQGQQVLMLYPSANRDEEVFANPDQFDVARSPHHLGFGQGSHFCLGANLARMELRVAFSELLRRLPDMEYAGDGPVFQRSALVRTCSRMDVRFTPEVR